MAINFAAANMAGYNNPQVQVFPVTVEPTGSKGVIVVGAPSYSTFTNIIKSGYMPALLATMPTGDRALLPFAAITKEGHYIFSAAMHTTDSPDTRKLFSILVGEHFNSPHFMTSGI